MRPLHVVVKSLPVAIPLVLSACAALGPIRNGGSGPAACSEEFADVREAQLLAQRIDHLEKQIDKYGSIVPKHADVWGQARLMMHRQEFEREMKADLCKFNPSFQAAISTSDQAFLMQALALQSAASAKGGAPDASGLINDPPAVARDTLTKIPVYSPLSNGKLAIEPTLIEDQKKRFLDHLHELRRINEGDDATDAPGYTLNLMSIPISVLTGDCTQTGFGAECTITATPRLTDDLLPNTVRDLVINDLVDLLGLQITKIIEALEDQDKTDGTMKLMLMFEALDRQQALRNGHGFIHRLGLRIVRDQKAGINTELNKLINPLAWAQGPSLRPGKRRPIPPSQAQTYFGGVRIVRIALALRSQILTHRACKDHVLYLDVQSVLRQELNAGYDFLSSETRKPIWALCQQELAEATRAVDLQPVRRIYDTFLMMVPEGLGLLEAIAWPILLDATLLNARFLEDMRSTQVAKGCPCVPEGWVPLCVPCPPPDARQLFNEYVRCRWPLRIFALDPETEDQNVTDSFRLRREMQLALSLAFASGNIGANSFTRYTRRIEQDIDTIAINRTQIGFSHGDNTFGWRFYPRVQTPPIDGNVQAVFRDMLVGGRRPGYDLRRRRLENGIRNCVALVIMPSFVPSVDLEVTANWFRLAHPKCKELTLNQTLRLSAEVQQLRALCAGTPDTGRYRPGDLSLVSARVEQLSQRLPLQHQLVNVPFENTHGGFDLLSTGVTDLGPELVGWYGAPGINPDGDTTLFLVGNNFSVHQTRIIVGGRFLDQSCPVACQGSTPAAAVACDSPASGKDGAHKGDQPAPKKPTAPAPKPGGCSTVGNEPTVVPAGFQCADEPTTGTNAGGSLQPKKDNTGTKTADPMQPKKDTTTPKKSDPTQPKKDDTTAKKDDTTDTTKKDPATDDTAKKTGDPVPATCGTGAQTYQVELLSRQVMRVVIPKGVYSKDGLVDIHIATPYGVSPALQVPVLGAAKPPAAPAGYSVADAGAKVTVDYDMVPRKNLPGYQLILVDKMGGVKINWNDPTGKVLKVVTLRVTFEIATDKDATTKTQLVISVPLVGNNGSFELADTNTNPGLTMFSQQVLEGLSRVYPFTPDKLPPASLESSQLEIIPESPLLLQPTPGGPVPVPSHDVKPVKIQGKITVDLTRVVK